MPHEQKPPPSNSFLSVRVDAEQKALVEQAAEREGLQVSSFIIMLLVRLHILPDTSLQKMKRRPVPFYNALHGLLGVVNKIGGNCKQLAAALPNVVGLDMTHAAIMEAAVAITDALKGRAIPEEVNLYRLQSDITKVGHIFNQIVRSVNMGKPSLAGLQTILIAIRDAADTITIALSNAQDPMEKAMEEMRANMKKAKDKGGT